MTNPGRPGTGILAVLLLALFASPLLAQDQDDPAAFVELMSGYLGLSERVVAMASSPEASVYLAIEGIVEIYEQRRDGPGAVAHLKRILDQHGSNQAVRNIVHLKLRDVYKETGDAKAALAQLDQIIAENAR